MSQCRSRLLLIRLAALRWVAVATSILYFSQPTAAVTTEVYQAMAKMGGRIIFPRQAMPTTELVDHSGQPFGVDELRGKWSVLFLGFTSCPDACPLSLSVLKTVAAQWQSDKFGDLQVILISVDPKRDQPAVLKDYLQWFNPRFRGVTGEKKQIDRWVNALGARYEFHDRVTNKLVLRHDALTQDYAVAHTPDFFIVAPDGRLAARIYHKSDAQMVANALALSIRSVNSAP